MSYNLIFSTNDTINHNWPRDEDGERLCASKVIESIITKPLNDQLAKYWSGSGSSLTGDGYQNWDFFNVPGELCLTINNALVSSKIPYLCLRMFKN